MWLVLGQSEKITAWLTPVWILATGIGIGFLIVLAVWASLLLLGRVQGLNRLHEKSLPRLIAGLVCSAVIFGLLFWYSSSLGYWSPQDMRPGEWGSHLFLMVIFYVGGALAAGFGLVTVVAQKRQAELQQITHDGFLFWISLICLAMALFSLLGYGLSRAGGLGMVLPVENADALVRSAVQWPGTGETRMTVPVPFPSPNDGTPVPVSIEGSQLRWFQTKSSQPVEVATQPITDQLSRSKLLDLPESETYSLYVRELQDVRFPDEAIDQLYVANRGDAPATVSFWWLTTPEYPQVFLIYWAAGSVIAVYLGYLFFAAAFPKVFAVAQSTFKTEISQPVFLILTGIGVIFVVASIYIPYNTFGEDIKMYKDSGLTLLRVLGIFLAVWAASKSLAEEIEGRTALTVLSKPVSRRQFILGKYSGIGMAIALLFIVLGIWFVIWVSYKPIYDSRESSISEFSWQTSFREAINTVPGLILAWLEAMVFAAISVVISTRLGILSNFMICFAIYVLGHLTPLIVQSAEVAQSFEGVVVFGQLISIIFPVLDHFDINAAITGDVQVPIAYLGWAAIYSALYGLIALLLALVLFEDRDLA